MSGFGLLAGMLLGLAAASLPARGWWMAATVAVAIGLTRGGGRAAHRALIATILGLALSTAVSARWCELRRPPQGADDRQLLEARVLTVPARAGATVRFDAEVRIDGERPVRTRRARLEWRDPSVEPRVGEQWQLLVRVESLYGPRNFSGADRALFAFRDGVHLAGVVLPSRLNARRTLAEVSIHTVRARVAARVRDLVVDRDAAALIVALAVGLTADLSADQWRIFNATGTTHLVAISGLHVTLFASVAFALARVVWRRLPWLHAVGRESFAATAGLAAAGAYALLAGVSVPTQRTWLMLAVFAISRCCARYVGVGRVWSLALIAVLLLDPRAPLAAGFWLSFTAVGVILLLASAPLAPADGAGRIAGLVRLQLAIGLALAPLTLAVFGSVSLVGLGVNLIAIPAISLLFVPLVLAGTLGVLWCPAVGAVCLAGAELLYEFGWPALSWAADLDFALWRAAPGAWWYVLAAPAVVLLLLPWPIAWRASALAVMFPLLTAPRAPEPGTIDVIVLDARRGAATLLATRSRWLIFDTGDTWSSRGAAARRVLMPALDAARARPDIVVLPTLTPDRAAGAAWLDLDRGPLEVRAAHWPGSVLDFAPCRDTMEWRDGIRFEWYLVRGRHCILRLVAGEHALLLGGDLDAASERELLQRLPRSALANDVVVLSRQAGGAGSSREWIETLRTGLAIATGGIEHSRARRAALDRWRTRGVPVLDTRQDGAVAFTLGPRGVTSLRTVRQSQYPFAWRRSP